MSQTPLLSPWQADYQRGCQAAAEHFAVAYRSLESSLGAETAMAMAPSLLPRIVSLAEGHANEQETLRQRQQAEQQEMQQMQSQLLEATRERPANPW